MLHTQCSEPDLELRSTHTILRDPGWDAEALCWLVRETVSGFGGRAARFSK